MNTKEFEVWCHKLLARLPELHWSLPFWPKSYMTYIPFGAFQIAVNWQPKDAIAEIESNIKLLLNLGPHPNQSAYLSAKILKQIDALVMISQRLIKHTSMPMIQAGLTRPQQLSNLNRKKYELEEQYQSLKKAQSYSKFNQEIESELKKVHEHLQYVKKLITHT